MKPSNPKLIYGILMKCKCGKGYSSPFDGLCKFCREKKYSRSDTKRAGVRYRGDGLTLDQLTYLKRTL